MADKRVITTQQAAELMHVGQETIRRWLKSGKIPGKRIGKSYLIFEDDLMRIIAEGSKDALKGS